MDPSLAHVLVRTCSTKRRKAVLALLEHLTNESGRCLDSSRRLRQPGHSTPDSRQCKTVETYRARIAEKLGLRTRSDIVRLQCRWPADLRHTRQHAVPRGPVELSRVVRDITDKSHRISGVPYTNRCADAVLCSLHCLHRAKARTPSSPESCARGVTSTATSSDRGRGRNT